MSCVEFSEYFHYRYPATVISICVKILDFGNVYFSDNVCSDLYVYILLNW